MCVIALIPVAGWIAGGLKIIDNLRNERDASEGVGAAYYTGMALATAEAGMGVIMAETAAAGSGAVRTAGRNWTTVQRAVTVGEVESTGETALLRGGRAGPHFVADEVPATAKGASNKLSLPDLRTHRMTVQVEADALSATSRVAPIPGRTGGGAERVADGDVIARILRVERLK